MANTNTPTRIVTGEVRLSYVHLFVPYRNKNIPNSEEKYSTTILIPKSDIATVQRIQTAINAAVAAGVPKVWAQHPVQPKTPLWDGDGVRSSGEAFGPECKGHWVMTISSKQPPQIVDAQGNPIINQSEVYSGMYARVSINFFSYSNSGNKGVGAGLGNVQKLRDGESLAGGKTAEEDFGFATGGIVSAQTIQQTYQQPQYAQPQQYAPPQQFRNVDPITGADLSF